MDRQEEQTGRTLYRTVDQEQLSVQEVMAWFLDFQNAWPAVQLAKQAMLDYLQPANGHVALDAGCGLGDDTRVLAAQVIPDGRATGLDASEALIAAAKERGSEAGPQPDFEVGDIAALPYSDATFDLVRCERTFQWLDDPEQALAELVRVAKPGGRIAVSDTDWASAIWDWGDPELSKRLLDAHRQNLPNSEAGRQLPPYFRQAGLIDIHVEVFPIVLDSRMIEAMTQNGIDLLFQPVLSDREWQRFEASREEAIDSGTAYGTSLLFLVGGTKPRA